MTGVQTCALPISESGYESVAGAICRHHVIHQKSKGVTAFIEDDHLLVMDKVSRESFEKRFNADIHTYLKRHKAIPKQVFLFFTDFH